MERARPHHNATLAVLAIGATAYSLQQTVVVVALPAFQRDLHTTTTWAAWVLSSFLLMSAVATPILGRLGDQFGKDRLLVVALSFFLVGSIASAAAWNIWSLIVFRGVMGVGGALFPLSFSIIRDEFPREKVGPAIGLISAVFGIGGGLGIPLSGVVVDNLSWRWLFVGGSAMTLVALVCVRRYVPESPVKTPSRVDLAGASLLALALASLLIGLTEGNGWGWSSGGVVALFAASALLLPLWVLVELRVPVPMIDVRMLARRTVLLTNICAAIAGFSMFGAFVLIPNLVQTPHGHGYGFAASATATGIYMLPSALVTLVSAPFAGLAARRLGAKWPMALGFACGTFSAISLATMHDRPWQIVVAMLFLGAGTSLTFASFPILITGAVRQTETGVATGINTVMRTTGGVIGTQVATAIVAAYLARGATVPAERGYVTAFWICAGVAAAGIALAVLVTPRVWRPATAVAAPAPLD